MELNLKKEERYGLTPNLSPHISNIEDDEPLTPEDIAKITGMSTRTVRRYCENGKLKAYCFNRKYIVYGLDFKEFMKNSIVRKTAIRRVL